MPEAYIYDALRTPRGKGNAKGALFEVSPVTLVVQLLQALQARQDFDTQYVEDLLLGCVTQIGEQGANVAKTAAQQAGYHHEVAALTLNRFCASGLEAVNQAAAYIKAGMAELIVAGGVESMSRVKMGSDGGAIFMDPSVALPNYFVPQGVSADLIATIEGFSRADLDRFGTESHQKAAQAWAEARFARAIVPVRDINGFTILDRDENVRPETTPEALAGLNPAFAMMGQMAGFDDVALQKYPEVARIAHHHHAGNSSAIVDGASLLLIGSETAGRDQGLRPRARIRAFAVTGTEPTIMLTGPAPATRKALRRAGLQPQDIDLFEVNEAFAAVVLRFIRELDVDPARVNVNGGAIALGHPLGATGAIILGTLLDELERQDKTLGLATLCVGGGMGIATIIERV